MRKIIIAAVIMGITLACASMTGAQGPYSGPFNYCPYCGANLAGERGQGWWGMGPGMMGREGYGYGMGPGMMGPGYGYGMGPGMMGRGGYGYGMGPGMMGPGYGYGMGPGYGDTEACVKFMEDTANLRKELFSKQHELNQAMRNSKTDPEVIGKLSKELYKIRQQIAEKAPQGCWR